MSEIKKGALKKQLGIPAGTHVPKTLIRKITKAEIGETIKNPTSIGHAKIPVTMKLKKRAFFLSSFY